MVTWGTVIHSDLLVHESISGGWPGNSVEQGLCYFKLGSKRAACHCGLWSVHVVRLCGWAQLSGLI